MLLQQLIFGIMIAALYGLASMGFSLVAGIMRIINFAHPDLLSLGAYTAYWLWVFIGFDPIRGLPVSIVLGLIAGLLLFNLIKKSISPDVLLLITFSVGIILEEGMRLVWSPNYRGISWSLGVIAFSAISVPVTYLVGFIVNITIIGCLYLILYKTYFGRALRAVSIDPEAAALCGVDVTSIRRNGFALSSILAFVGGSLLLIYLPVGINPYYGQTFLAKSIIIVTLGGIANPWGALIGGVVVGVFDQMVPLLLRGIPFVKEPFSFAPFLYFVIFLCILAIRPQGILGRR
ncbi:MAG: branched-chain amino acid ABC transporter permease [Candidatus Bathyarchaeia archaeon]